MGLQRLLRETIGAPYYRSHPVEAISYTWSKYRFARQRAGSVEDFLLAVGLDPQTCLADFDQWEPVLDDVVATTGARLADQGSLVPAGAKLLYAIVRGTRPRCVIETGVAAGVSSSFLGAALITNGTGKLYSIDLPPAALRRHSDGSAFDWKKEGGVGWAIPSVIRDGLGERHELILEDVRTALPRLLNEVGVVDCFVHDDLHTPDHMEWEFELVWPHLPPGGVLVADDVNHAWTRFAARRGMESASLLNIARVGVLRKPASGQTGNGDSASR